MTYNSQTVDYSTVVESFAWFFRLSKDNSDKRQILKEPTRARFIKRGDVEFVSYPSVRFSCK